MNKKQNKGVFSLNHYNDIFQDEVVNQSYGLESVNVTSFLEFLKSFHSLKLPLIQRGVSWDTKNILEFFIEMLKIPGNEEYLNQVILSRVKDQPSNFYVYDGQQRITVLLMFLSAAAIVFDEDDLNNIQKDFIERQLLILEEDFYVPKLNRVENEQEEEFGESQFNPLNMVLNLKESKLLCDSSGKLRDSQDIQESIKELIKNHTQGKWNKRIFSNFSFILQILEEVRDLQARAKREQKVVKTDPSVQVDPDTDDYDPEPLQIEYVPLKENQQLRIKEIFDLYQSYEENDLSFIQIVLTKFFYKTRMSIALYRDETSASRAYKNANTNNKPLDIESKFRTLVVGTPATAEDSNEMWSVYSTMLRSLRDPRWFNDYLLDFAKAFMNRHLKADDLYDAFSELINDHKSENHLIGITPDMNPTERMEVLLAFMQKKSEIFLYFKLNGKVETNTIKNPTSPFNEKAASYLLTLGQLKITAHIPFSLVLSEYQAPSGKMKDTLKEVEKLTERSTILFAYYTKMLSKDAKRATASVLEALGTIQDYLLGKNDQPYQVQDPLTRLQITDTQNEIKENIKNYLFKTRKVNTVPKGILSLIESYAMGVGTGSIILNDIDPDHFYPKDLVVTDGYDFNQVYTPMNIRLLSSQENKSLSNTPPWDPKKISIYSKNEFFTNRKIFNQIVIHDSKGVPYTEEQLSENILLANRNAAVNYFHYLLKTLTYSDFCDINTEAAKQ